MLFINDFTLWAKIKDLSIFFHILLLPDPYAIIPFMKKFKEQLVKIKAGSVMLEGILALPSTTQAVITFAHGSGSSRLSPRNIFVAKILQKAGFGTLLFDLLTKEEDVVYETRFNIRLLTDRLLSGIQWVMTQPVTKQMRLGLFGASTGAASAIEVAALLDTPQIGAIVSRGGRPDLAMPSLSKIKAPTLFIVGGNDAQVLVLNQTAYEKLHSEKRLSIVADASHLFEEPGALEEVARLATDWFNLWLLKKVCSKPTNSE